MININIQSSEFLIEFFKEILSSGSDYLKNNLIEHIITIFRIET
jgi:hypothetical protein